MFHSAGIGGNVRVVTDPGQVSFEQPHLSPLVYVGFGCPDVAECRRLVPEGVGMASRNGVSSGSSSGEASVTEVVAILAPLMADGRELAVADVEGILSPEIAWHDGLADHAGIAQWLAGYNGLMRVLGNPRQVGTEWLIGDDFAVGTWTLVGMHSGPFMLIPATNRPLEVPVISIWRVRAGRVWHLRTVTDATRTVARIAGGRLADRRDWRRGRLDGRLAADGATVAHKR